MTVRVCSVGKIKEKFYREALSEYGKRLFKYCKLEMMEVIDEKTKEGASSAEEEAVLEKEGKRLLEKIPERSFVIVLAIKGKEWDSLEMAKNLEKLFVEGKSDITFVIGGSLGLHEAVYKRADLLLSFSKLTFPHQLMRVLLLEQIYRCFRINSGEPYHKQRKNRRIKAFFIKAFYKSLTKILFYWDYAGISSFKMLEFLRESCP